MLSAGLSCAALSGAKLNSIIAIAMPNVFFTKSILIAYLLHKNSKSEYRNPKQTGAKINPKYGKSKTSNPTWARLEFVPF
jgi:hypothetical protein